MNFFINIFLIKITFFKARFSLETRAFLEEWFLKNQKTKPFKDSIEFLSDKTNLSHKQVSKWIRNKHQRQNKQTTQLKVEQVILLKNYYKNVNKHPFSHELVELSKSIGENETRIRKWFDFERHKETHY